MNKKIFFIGALTSKPYAFKGRNWELRKVFTVDLFDSLGSNITLEVKGKKIMRIKPRSNDSINEDWISDKVRFSADGLLNNRLVLNYYKQKNFYNKINLDTSFKLIKFNLLFMNFTKKYGNFNVNINGFLGENNSAEGIILFKNLLNKLGSSNIINLNSYKPLSNDLTLYNRLNMTINNIEKSDLLLLIGLDPRFESPLLNLRIRKKFLKGNLVIGSFGFLYNPLYNLYNLGNSPKNLINFIEGRHKFSYKFILSNFPSILLSSSILNRVDGNLIYNLLNNLIVNLNLTELNLNLITLNSNDGNVNELGVNTYITNLEKSNLNINFYFNTNKVNNKLNKNDFNIYMGTHGDSEILKSDLLIPISSIYEFDGLYINNEGLCQDAKYVTNIANNINNEINLLLSLYIYLGFKTSLKNQIDIRNFLINNYSSNYKLDDVRIERNSIVLNLLKKNKTIIGFLYKYLFKSNIENFYMTNLISKNSKVMGECSQKLLNFNNINYNKK